MVSSVGALLPRGKTVSLTDGMIALAAIFQVIAETFSYKYYSHYENTITILIVTL